MIVNPINEYNHQGPTTQASAESKMTKQTSQRIQSKASESPKHVSGNPAALSERLSKLLALAGCCKDVKEMDSKTIQQSLRRLQSAIEKRRSTKALQREQTSQESIPQESRRRVLIETVGVQKAQRIIALIREIRVLRLRRRDLLGSSALESHQPMVCGRGGCSANVYSLPKTSDGKLPQEVRDIFFHTSIVDALEKSPPSSFAKLPWDQLYAQGQKHVQAYRSWLRLEVSSE